MALRKANEGKEKVLQIDETAADVEIEAREMNVHAHEVKRALEERNRVFIILIIALVSLVVLGAGAVLLVRYTRAKEPVPLAAVPKPADPSAKAAEPTSLLKKPKNISQKAQNLPNNSAKDERKGLGLKLGFDLAKFQQAGKIPEGEVVTLSVGGGIAAKMEVNDVLGKGSNKSLLI